MKSYFLLIPYLFCFNVNLCFSQDNKPLNDKFVIVLDVQSKFYSNHKLKSAAAVMLQNINSVIERSDPDKVIYVNAAGKVLNISFFNISVDTVAYPWDSRLNLVNDNVFTKYEGDAFTEQELVDFLNKQGAKDIILMGVMAEECVYQTTLGGIANGFNMYLIPEAILGKESNSKEKAIGEMTEKGAKVISIDDIMHGDQ